MKMVINYCWFGRNNKSDLIIKCLESWKKYLPNYEIVEWNEDNFDVNCCEYVKEAYELKKWAFVSDYCRLWVLYKYGGLYLDTDVEIIKSTNLFRFNTIGFEKKKLLNPGLVLSCEADNWFCKEMLEEYNKDHFVCNGIINYRTICDRATDIFKKHGLRLNNKYQNIDGFNVYPSDFFNPIGTVTNDTVSIHHFAKSWIDDDFIKLQKKNRNFQSRIYYFIKKLFGKKFADKLRRIKNK